MKQLFVLCLITLLGFKVQAQNAALTQKLQQVIAGKKAQVGIAVLDDKGQPLALINHANYYAMQSVFKFHIALYVLHQVDAGVFKLTDTIAISQDEMNNNMYSPLRDLKPKGGKFTLAKIIEYTVAHSDNVGCDLLLKMVGGPAVVNQYFKKNGFTDIDILYSESQMSNSVANQLKNRTTPVSAVNLLFKSYTNQPALLKKSSHDFIWDVMLHCKTGQKRLPYLLPKQTKIAHKTGSAGTDKNGFTHATNDIGLIFLPNGKPVYVSVFVGNSTEPNHINEAIIAQVGAAVYTHCK